MQKKACGSIVEKEITINLREGIADWENSVSKAIEIGVYRLIGDELVT